MRHVWDSRFQIYLLFVYFLQDETKKKKKKKKGFSARGYNLLNETEILIRIIIRQLEGFRIYFLLNIGFNCY